MGVDVEDALEPAIAGKDTPLPLQNSYAAKKTVAQGMMDVALVMANANQMRFVIEFCGGTKTYTFVLVMLVASLLLQVAVGISLIFKGRCDLSGDSKLQQANRINNYVLAGVFLITVINVFITAFSTTPPVPQSLPPGSPVDLRPPQ